MALSAGTVSLAVLPDTKEFGEKLKSGLLGKTAGVGEGMGSAILGGLKSMAGPIMAVTAAFGIEKLVEGSVKAFEGLAGTLEECNASLAAPLRKFRVLPGR
jgi:Na+/H+ antiporter NhaC